MAHPYPQGEHSQYYGQWAQQHDQDYAGQYPDGPGADYRGTYGAPYAPDPRMLAQQAHSAADPIQHIQYDVSELTYYETAYSNAPHAAPIFPQAAEEPYWPTEEAPGHRTSYPTSPEAAYHAEGYGSATYPTHSANSLPHFAPSHQANYSPSHGSAGYPYVDYGATNIPSTSGTALAVPGQAALEDHRAPAKQSESGHDRADQSGSIHPGTYAVVTTYVAPGNVQAAPYQQQYMPVAQPQPGYPQQIYSYGIYAQGFEEARGHEYTQEEYATQPYEAHASDRRVTSQQRARVESPIMGHLPYPEDARIHDACVDDSHIHDGDVYMSDGDDDGDAYSEGGDERWYSESPTLSLSPSESTATGGAVSDDQPTSVSGPAEYTFITTTYLDVDSANHFHELDMRVSEGPDGLGGRRGGRRATGSKAPRKEPFLACFFCRGRKIACHLQEVEGSGDRTCV
ncbi:hypothetical protein BV25DRAFT_1919282 [Artomyces pyxidatus]|uniref:Uncharacterized protein n=1 Tax=Artomyces pyxidatus TaxID=48021 RepID=A0ACB8SP95_9AGAM|nr:hypothetical protein BV25DRAFT_1919282 [Artomyces pyxidatus]